MSVGSLRCAVAGLTRVACRKQPRIVHRARQRFNFDFSPVDEVILARFGIRFRAFYFGLPRLRAMHRQRIGSWRPFSSTRRSPPVAAQAKDCGIPPKPGEATVPGISPAVEAPPTTPAPAKD